MRSTYNVERITVFGALSALKRHTKYEILNTANGVSLC